MFDRIGIKSGAADRGGLFAARFGKLALPLAVVGALTARGDSVPLPSKHIIGPTASLTEISTGLSFPARIDTGARSCSLHVEKLEVEDESPKRLQNVGKTIRFLVKGSDGKETKEQWIETKIADAVRVRSSVLGDGEYDRRYKVRLTFDWKGFRKEALVTLNDRSNMEYPLLIGRNFLRGDFLVDVDLKDDE